MSVNKAMILGHVGDDVKVHYFEGGNCIGRFPVATNETYTNKQGEKVTNTEWHNVVARNKAAETLEKYLKKGDQIFIEGNIKTRSWEAEGGNKRYSTEIHMNTFSFISGKKAESVEAVVVSEEENQDSLPF